MHLVTTLMFFDVLLTVHLSITLVNDQLDAQFFYFIIHLFQSSTCFEQCRAYHQEVKCTGRPLTESDDTRCCINTI